MQAEAGNIPTVIAFLRLSSIGRSGTMNLPPMSCQMQGGLQNEKEIEKWAGNARANLTRISSATP